MRSYTIKTAIFFSVSLAFFAVCSRPSYGQEDFQTKYEKLKADYESVSADRDNILLQVKGLVDFKAKCQGSDEAVKKAIAEKDSALADLKKAQEQSVALSDKVSGLETERSSLLKEHDEQKKTLDKMVLDYKIVPETIKENSRLRADNAKLQRDIKNAQIVSKQLEEQKINDSAQMEIYRRQIKEFKKRYEQSMAKNRSLERKIEQIPSRFAEVARENKVLIKETALMHYNLGVFYTKNKEYSRAIAEFEKALELNPDDPAAHYNLGFIYAEYLVNRPKAIQHFRKYLSIVKTEDKDVDWVKKYILTWQTWEGKKPVD